MINLDFLKNKIILVTGASGVIGYNLCKTIKGISPYIYINYRRELPRQLSPVLDDSFYHIKGDCLSFLSGSWSDEFPYFDYIFHCACYGQPGKFMQDQQRTFILNTFIVDALANQLKPNGQFIYLSSSEVYANNEKIYSHLKNGSSEDDSLVIDPTNTRNCYILSKLFGESILKYTYSDIKHKSIRICLCYGPGFKKDDARVLYQFIAKGVNKNEISLLDDGSAIRSYIYVDDCINGILNITREGKFDLYNLGGNSLIPIKDLATYIMYKINAEGGNCTIKLGNRTNRLSSSPDMACVDITRYKKEFGILNKTTLFEGIGNCIKWYKNL